MANQQFDERDLTLNAMSFQVSDGVGWVYWFNSPTANFRLDEVWATNADSIDHTFYIGVGAGGTFGAVGKVTIPAAASADQPNVAEMLSQLAPASFAGLAFGGGGAIRAKLGEAVTSDDLAQLVAFGGTL